MNYFIRLERSSDQVLVDYGHETIGWTSIYDNDEVVLFDTLAEAHKVAAECGGQVVEWDESEDV